MSKQYNIDMNIHTDDLTPEGGILVRPDKTERSPAEVFALMCKAGINGMNQQGSYEQIKELHRIIAKIDKAVENGVLVANKTEIQTIKGCIRGNRGWPNHKETITCLDRVMERLTDAKECLPSGNQGADPSKEK